MLKHEKPTVRNAVLVFCREEPTVIQRTTATQASGDARPPGMSFGRRRTSFILNEVVPPEAPEDKSLLGPTLKKASIKYLLVLRIAVAEAKSRSMRYRPTLI